MNREEASRILETVRRAGPMPDDPLVAEALRMAAGDPELSRQLARQYALDAALSAGVKSIPVPAGLKASLVAPRRIVRPHFWQDWRTAAAAAAAIALFVAGSVVAINRSTAGFATFRNDLITERWADDPHLNLESSDLGHIRQWLALNNVASDFELPNAMNELRPRGARVLQADGQKVALICLADGARHFHLFILDHPNFSDLPPKGGPEFEKCGVWKTATWRQGERVYVLTGMNYPAFVSKFRKDGRWEFKI